MKKLGSLTPAFWNFAENFELQAVLKPYEYNEFWKIGWLRIEEKIKIRYSTLTFDEMEDVKKLLTAPTPGITVTDWKILVFQIFENVANPAALGEKTWISRLLLLTEKFWISRFFKNVRNPAALEKVWNRQYFWILPLVST